MKYTVGMLLLFKQADLVVFRVFYHRFRLFGLYMLKHTGSTLTAVCMMSVFITPNSATADIVYPSGYLATIGNPGIYVERWGTTGGSTPGIVTCPAATCYVGIAHQWRNTTTHPGYYWAFIGRRYISVPAGTLWDEAIRQWIEVFGRSGSGSHSWYFSAGNLINTCMRATAGGLAPDNIPLPATCGVILPAPAKCDFTTQAITLDHQTIDKNSVDGNTASTNFTVNCSAAAQIAVDNVQGNGPTQVLPGITSTLQIDGRPLGTRIQLPSGTSTHTASSTLRDTGAAYGDFNASIVLRITIF
ncbi:hypothetical protein AQS70_15235 [Pseudomonas endophytica]|uniref:Fimbrial adhesin MrpH C-terminal domain-containing protein n=2 Tax=Pseudomonas endophytica TaxID=1563157 RepID=A0A0Q0XQH4_9PSED|nr:hypothetical protein AQS70_15235 [Pseudomonas endophytica]